ncbi:RagB/SusD family nutrient uptake outer membrane protein [Bacteroides gallinaceum]|uniref:RagB/SusD family nutrient uptake outer membrane protein n=1 Tax=Bacteroides gallinaceum TaxID=1462571 RepID=A0ABT7VDW2_9BACE|nr:RagB/SusD family nutrient uptake outer membrane protein [Bacteroides gallinaceum]MDM8324486.1 RagB/SusD family nutrient uptake outer membrane protein [Bacteroides gallinaceum]
MKKKYSTIKLVSLFVGSILTVSCNDSFLDRYPIAEISPENSFKTADDLRLYTNGFYEQLPSIRNIIDADLKTDNVLYSSIPEEQRSHERILPSETGSGGWDWEDLREINLFFDNYQRCTDEAGRDKYEGVARFFRAWFYFDKVKRFGDVPWYETVIQTGDTDLLYKARDSREFVVSKIIQDLEIAVDKLGDERASDQVTRWTALALLSRVCLYEGTFRKYHTELGIQGSDTLLQKAYEAAGRVMDESGYTLYSTGNPDTDYRDLFASTLKEDEVILGRRYSLTLNQMHNVNYYLTSRTQRDIGLTKDLVDSYLQLNGMPFTSKTGYATMGFYDEMQSRDRRLAQTIRSLGYQRIGGTATLLPDFAATMTGYQLCKFLSDETQDGDGASYQDVAFIRYAEVLLNYAEAKAELGIITQDDIDRTIRLIRSRVSMPNLDMTSANQSPDAVLAALYPNVSGSCQGIILEIRRERRIELVMEGFRWDDLVRWKAGKLLEPHFIGMYFPSLGEFDLDGDGAPDLMLYTGTAPSTTAAQSVEIGGVLQLTEGDHGNLIGFKDNTKQFDESRDYLYPLPTGDLLLNENLVQNPDWDK